MCLDAGVNLIDTADVYSGGFAEEITGEVIKGRRDSLLLSTKVRMTMGDGPNDAGLSRHHIISGCEASLRRLGTDHIDIYHVHEWDGQTRLEETMSALDSLVGGGEGALPGGVELRRLAADEGAVRRRRLRLRAVRGPAGLLLARVAGRRVRACPALRRPGPRHPRLVAAGRRPGFRQVPARRVAVRADAAAVGGVERAAGPRQGEALRHDRGPRRRRRPPIRRRPRRSRSPGCSAGPR